MQERPGHSRALSTGMQHEFSTTGADVSAVADRPDPPAADGLVGTVRLEEEVPVVEVLAALGLSRRCGQTGNRNGHRHRGSQGLHRHFSAPVAHALLNAAVTSTVWAAADHQ